MSRDSFICNFLKRPRSYGIGDVLSMTARYGHRARREVEQVGDARCDGETAGTHHARAIAHHAVRGFGHDMRNVWFAGQTNAARNRARVRNCEYPFSEARLYLRFVLAIDEHHTTSVSMGGVTSTNSAADAALAAVWRQAGLAQAPSSAHGSDQDVQDLGVMAIA